MPTFEYKVVPAPTKGRKGKGIRGAEARFSHALEELMNELASDGWEYQRAETLPSVERAGLTGTTTAWRNLLVFRRPSNVAAEAFAPELLPAPAAEDTMPPASADGSSSDRAKTDAGLRASRGAANAATAPGDTVRLTAEKSWKERADKTDEIGPVGSTLEKFARSHNRPKSED